MVAVFTILEMGNAPAMIGGSKKHWQKAEVFSTVIFLCISGGSVFMKEIQFLVKE